MELWEMCFFDTPAAVIRTANHIFWGYMSMLEKIVNIIAQQLGCDPDEITEDSAVAEDLGADSLDIVEILMAIEDSFEITVPDEDIPGLKTVRDIVSYTEANM